MFIFSLFHVHIRPHYFVMIHLKQYYWYKADTHGHFKLGSKEFWELSKGLGSDDEAEQYNPSNQKKRGPSINVKKIQVVILNRCVLF